MDKNLNEKLQAGLLKNLEEYLPQCKASLRRNEHMHEFRSVDSVAFGPYVTNKLSVLLRALIEDFTDSYMGGGNLGDVVGSLIDIAKHQRKLRPDGPFDQIAWDAVTVDFLNFWANKRCMDLGLYAKDLASP